jgi:hypothetical protein
MDRSYLSHTSVVADSRAFVCIRLTTYENAEEMRMLKNLFVGRSGDVENTVFCILAPDGKNTLSRPHRGPKHLYTSAEELARSMKRIAAAYPSESSNQVIPSLPRFDDVRLALNVAACDNQPLVMAVADSAESRARLERTLAALAWSDTFIGRFQFLVVRDARALLKRDGEGVFVVQADRYGLKASVLAECAADATPATLAATLRKGGSTFQSLDTSFPQHIRQGHLDGVFWETATPVTDPMERMAREKGKRRP